MKYCILILTVIFFHVRAKAQRSTINIIGIHQLVSESVNENKQQVKARDRQTLTTGNEQVNLTQLTRLKGIYRTLQQRYNTLGTAINVAGIGIYAVPMVSRIVSNQAQIIDLASKDPALVVIGYASALQFAEKAKGLTGYVTGLTMALGDINQMNASDRKLLFDHVLAELSVIQDLSGNMLRMMQYSGLPALLRGANPFQNYIDADRSIATEIIRNAKYLKK